MARRALAIAVLLPLAEVPARSTEIHWRAEVADLIVVGKLHVESVWPGLWHAADSGWRVVWRMTATVSADELLYGSRPRDSVRFQFVCPIPECGWHPPLDWSYFETTRMWFFRKVNDQWELPVDGWLQSGEWSLSWRANFEDYIRRYKH